MKYTTTLTAALLLAGSAAFAQMGDMGAHFMEQWDMDSDGKVTLAEVTDMRGNIFAMFDTDSDGSLNAAEWQGVEDHMTEEMQAKGMGQGMGKRQAKGANGMQAMMMMFGKGHGGMMHESMSPAFNDADGDGVVTEAEFTGASEKLFPMLDTNADGAVTPDDFGPAN